MKYRVGDKVRIVSSWVGGTQNSDGAMDCWLGKVMTIRNIIGGYHYRMKEDNLTWCWFDHDIEGLVVSESTNYTKNADGLYTVDDKTMTEEEFNDRYIICYHCGNAVDKSDTIYCETNGEEYCIDCADNILRYCDCCENYFLPCDMVRFCDSDSQYCDTCASAEGYRCHDCGDWYRYSDSGSWNGDYWYCYDCYGNNMLDSYHSMKGDGYYEFYGDESRRDAPYMGFELEVDSSERQNIGSAIKYASRKFGDFLHFEEDGSLNYGFENISHPASLSYHLSRMGDYKDLFDEYTSEGFTSHNNGRCGLHIHIDRTFFGKNEDSAIAKLLYIFEKHWENLMKFSRRTSGQLHWCCRYKTEVSDSIKEIVEKSKRSSCCYSRYYAVNLTNENTIEIRMWRGTMNKETFEATLKFTDRLARLAKNRSAVAISRMSFEEILGDDEVIVSYWNRVKNR